MVKISNERVKSCGFKHTVGIIPLNSYKLTFGMPWHDSMLPIAPNFMIIEKAVFECAIFGCKSIWIVCPDSMLPLFRKRLGDYVVEPLSTTIMFDKFGEQKKYIPIYYVTINYKQSYKDSMVGNMLYGARIVRDACKRLSRELIPDFYYVCNPYGMFDYFKIKNNRNSFKKCEFAFWKTKDGKSVLNGYPLPFVMNNDYLDKFYKTFKEKATGAYQSFDPKTQISIPLPLEERYSGKRMKFIDVMVENIDLENKKVYEYELDSDYYYIDNWRGYSIYCGSLLAATLKKPSYVIMKYRELAEIVPMIDKAEHSEIKESENVIEHE